jgi:hypothetical protein
VDLSAGLDAPCSPDALFAWVQELDTYPRWLGIVPRAVSLAPGPGGEPAWEVDLQGRLGPFARSKRLRMVRAELVVGQHVRFERRELDGRRHSPWVLRADVRGAPGGAHLEMHLHYGGAFWGPVLERLLADEIERGRTRLLELVTAGERP